MDKWLAAWQAARYVGGFNPLLPLVKKYVVWINAQTTETAAILALLEAAEKTADPNKVLVRAAALLTANAPTVASASVVTGTTAGGTAVTLTGTNLLGVTGVTFGGTAATSVRATSDTTVTLVTPAHASGAVAMVVTTTSGSVTKAAFFTYA